MARENKVDIDEEQKKKCRVIIHGASAAAAAACAGIAQIPLADNAVLAPIQVGMIISLAKVFDQDLGKGAAQGLLSTFAATFVGRSVTQVLFGWIPLAGNAINSATAATLTESIGWMAVDRFAADCDRERKATFTKESTESSTQQQTQPDNAQDDDFESWKKQTTEDAQKALENPQVDAGTLEDLLNRIEKRLDDLPKDDPLRELYQKLLEKSV